VDRAVSNIAFTRHCTRTSGSSFKALPRLGRCVSYEEHDEVAPTVREVTSLASRTPRPSAPATRSSTSQAILDPTAAVGVTKKRTP
jgi:hypothetical protein